MHRNYFGPPKCHLLTILRDGAKLMQGEPNVSTLHVLVVVSSATCMEYMSNREDASDVFF